MIPLDDYAVVPSDANLVGAVRTLKQAERRLQPDRQPAGAVLVADSEGMIIGHPGHLDLEHFECQGNISRLVPRERALYCIDALCDKGCEGAETVWSIRHAHESHVRAE